MTASRHALVFPCAGEKLLGVVTRPAAPASRAVVVVVGGPQYRVGSHRQFVLLAERLAEAGYAVLRFDCRGMGDSTGRFPGFEHIEADIAAAVDALMSAVPEVREVVLWGLCDGATAALFYACTDRRVSGIALLNPWIRSPHTEARAQLRHYYLKRALDASAWRSLLGRRGAVRTALNSLSERMRAALAPGDAGSASAADAGATRNDSRPLADRMAEAMVRFEGPAMVVLSGQDLTAREFADTTGASRGWRRLLGEPRVTRHEIPEATHTFSRHDWREQVAGWTVAWMGSW